jgi:hypothetical protein
MAEWWSPVEVTPVLLYWNPAPGRVPPSLRSIVRQQVDFAREIKSYVESVTLPHVAYLQPPAPTNAGGNWLPGQRPVPWTGWG